MADEEKTEETVEETPAEETPAGASVEAEEERPAGDVNPPAPALTKAQQRLATRQAAASQRKPRTPEERQAERQERRTKLAAQRRRRRAKEKAARAERPKGTSPEPVAHTEGRQKVRQGRVVSDKADKTITVRIESARRHRRYEKIVRSTSTLH